MTNGFRGKAELIWSVANLLRGHYKQADYGKVILPFTVLRRLDSVLAPTKAAVLAESAKRRAAGITNLAPFLTKKSGFAFFNESLLDFDRLLADPANIARNLKAYIEGFSPNVRDIAEEWKFSEQIDYLAKQDLLYLAVQQFRGVDLAPALVTNHDMGLIFEELIRRFAELSNETAGEHFTPREVVQLAVNLLFAPDDEALTKPGTIRSIYDPTAGTGGMLSVAEEHLRGLNAGAKARLFGQELNPESYAICKADMLVKGQEADNIILGNTLSADGHKGRTFDYLLANPPFGVEWKNVRAAVEREHKEQGWAGRFGPGLPRVSDGSLLFLLHMLSKMNPETGSRVGIVLNGSPLFTGDAGGGESEIRRWIFANDYLEAIVALPTDMFYNTGIATYIWVLTNRKPEERRGRIQFVNAMDMFAKMPKGLGNKRKYLTDEHIARICQAYGDIEEGAISKVFPTERFGYRKVTIQRPLRVTVRLDSESLAAFATACADKGDGALAAACSALAASRGEGPHSDFNVFEGWLEEGGCRVTAARRKLLLGALAVTDPDAEPVVRAAHSPKKAKPDRNFGLWPSEFEGKARVIEYESDSALRDTENVPLGQDVVEFVEREVFPFVPDAWIDAGVVDHKDGQVGKVGYEINFTREFYVYQPPRPVAEIQAEIEELESEIFALLRMADA